MKLLLALLFSLLLSCSSTRKVSLIDSIDRLPPLQESVINIPIKIYARPFLQKAEAMAPLEFSSSGWPGYFQSTCDFRYKYRFIRSGLRFSCVNNKAMISLIGNYQIAGSKTVCAFGKQVSPWISGSCGFSPEPMRRVQINIGSELRLQPNYTIRSRSGVEKIIPVDKCLVSLLNTDVTSEVSYSIRSSVNAFATFLDQILAAIDFSKTISEVATMVGKKIPLSNYGFIKVNPSAVKISNINYNHDTVYLTAGFACYPDISSDSVNHALTKFLPPLGNADLSGGIQINANASYAYPFIDSLLNYLVKDKSFNISGRKIQVRNLGVNGLENNKVELRIDFEGDKSGTLFLIGTPSLDRNKQIISIPDLDYSLQSKDLILNLGKTFFDKRILHAIREKTKLDIKNLYHNNKKQLDTIFNRRFDDNIFTRGSTTDIKLIALVVNRDNLLFQVSVDGLMEVTLAGKKK